MTEHAKGLQELYGVAVGPGGAIVVAEGGAGRVLVIAGKEVKTVATGLSRPSGVAAANDGSCFVAEAGRGPRRAYQWWRQQAVGGLKEPQGLLLDGDDLYIVDAGARELVCFSTKTRQRATVAANLPVGAPLGVIPHVLAGIPGLLPGPLTPFAGIAQSRDGTIYVAADAEGSILAFRRS